MDQPKTGSLSWSFGYHVDVPWFASAEAAMPKPPASPPPGPVGDFASYLRDLLIHAGKPDYSQMCRATDYGRSALSAAFAGKQLPTWELAARLVRFLGGDVDDALQRWATAKTKTWTEPGFTEDLAAGLEAGQQAPAGLAYPTRPEPHDLLPVPRQLPMDVPHFTGRGSAITQLDAVLAQGVEGMPMTVVISAIDGTAGVGKTALAVHWAHRVRDRFPDGQLYINLRGYGPEPEPIVSPEEALDRFLQVLNVSPARIPAELEERAALYRSLLVGRRMLILLDNAATPHQVRPLLPGSPGCQVVVTSRSRLSGLVVGEGARRITLDVLAPEEALTLLREIIGPTRVDAEPRAATELARFCAFLPLALRIAAERAASYPCATLADLMDELADEHNRLEVLATDDETTSVRSVFSWSYRALGPDCARAFRLLGLHFGPDISTSAAAALIGVAPACARSLLEALSNVHLIEPVARNRYRFHDLLRPYAFERAKIEETEQDRDAAVWRVLNWYLHTADAADYVLLPYRRRVPLQPPESDSQHLSFDARGHALEWCEVERANLAAAIRHADQAGYHALAWKLPVVLWGFFTLRQNWPDWIATHRIGLAAAKRSHDQFGEAYVLTSLINAYHDLHEFEEAINSAEQAVAIWRKIDYRWGEGAALTFLSMTYRDLCRFEESIDSAQQALVIFDQISDLWARGWALRCLGESYRKIRRFEEAITNSQQALDAFCQTGDLWGQGWSLHNLGDTYRNLGRFNEAISYFRQALDVRRKIRDRQGEAVTLHGLGVALHDVDRRDRARECWQRALTIFDDLADPLAAAVRARLGDDGQAGRDSGIRRSR